MKKQIVYILFWMKSNRGTDTKRVVKFNYLPSKDEINDRLIYWAEHQPAWNHGDNIVRYGYRQVKMPPRAELLKRWEKVCQRYSRAKEERDLVSAMLNPTELTATTSK